MGEVKLNLARKWRSKNFEEIIGQDLLIRMLKNGLYLQQFFPVYLFSGQRGCGKTTTARVFGAALNCEQLNKFQEHPQKNVIPCLSCVSCKAMEQGKHPDFIEIDAASHTGVDNVRMLIDSAFLLPLMGGKKIYLIDEAHMLSKAAFNAFLKILEEPPSSVVFILATTDPQKIIETVRSRCFQLFFKPVETNTLQKRLRMVCEREEIAYDDAGLATIVKQTEGSVRDALNLLEQIRFSSNSVTHEAVLRVLGYIDDQELITLFRHVLMGSEQQVLQTISKMEWKKFSAQIMWNQLLELVRTALWLRYDVMPTEFVEYHDEIKVILRHCSVKQLTVLLQTMYDQELLFGKTTAKHDFLEVILLQICQSVKKGGSDDGSPSSAMQVPAAVGMADDEEEDDELEDDGDEDPQDDDEEEEDEESLSCLSKGTFMGSEAVAGRAGINTDRWKQFVVAVEQLNEPLLNSIFVQGFVKKFDESTGVLEVEFSQESAFFSALLADKQSLWQPAMKKIFGDAVSFTPLFTGAPLPKKKRVVSDTPAPKQPQSPYASAQSADMGHKRSFSRQARGVYKPFAHELPIDISDKEVWRKTHMIMNHIPGTVKEIRG